MPGNPCSVREARFSTTGREEGERRRKRERERESEREGGEGEERIVKKLGGLYEVFPNRKHEG